MNTPRVSIVIPVHNTKKYLKKCIDSIIHQTISDIEIIVVDDASTQDIAGFLQQEYGQQESIIYLRNENSLGPGGARNRGLNIANGRYIHFCDSDDWLDLNFFQTVIEYMDKTDADIGMVSMVRNNDIPNSPLVYKCKYNELITLDSDMALRILSHQYENGITIVPACINKIYRKSFLEQINAKFEEDIYYQGILFCIYTFLHAETVICIPNIEYHHYLRYQSITQSFDDKHMYSFHECFKRMKNYFKTENQYTKYEYNFYKILEHYLNVVISEIFEYIPEETLKKKYICQAIGIAKEFVDFESYVSYVSAEEIRRHIQPNLNDTFSILY